MSFLDRIFASNWIASREDMADFLERHFGWAPPSKHNEWDDFENVRLRDSDLDRERLAILDELGAINGPLSPEARSVAEDKARHIIDRLRQDDAAHKSESGI
jgi:hypothetical protein